ncbi:hypothetical protein PybrP1_008520 [[Pythium] brassicae (nom. inval.)]|nr:hypothetical protein PybrP1_008520 [[Pythium] brassicae (nom. inval.)]
MASSGGASGAQPSMMKEYLRKQLRYWVENFRDDMLPRDFGAKSFSRSNVSLHKIDLKLHKVAAVLQIPKPLLVTRAYCSEVTIRVPSWTAAEKFVQEPLSFRVVDLFIDVKHARDCDDAYCRAAEARVQAAIMEPDPLGSIASWYAFSTILNERVELVVDNVYLKLFSGGVSRVRVELTNFHSRTTNALWQDMRDLTACVDRSPDGLLKTRFKFVSFGCSILLTQPESGAGPDAPTSKPGGTGATSSSHPPIKLLRDHAVSLRMTLFGHRASKHEVWETLSQVIDVNLHTLPFDYDFAQLVQIFEVYATVSGWLRSTAEQERVARTSGAGLDTSELLLHHHHVQRGAVMKPKSSVGAVETSDAGCGASFALQLTFRLSADATFRFVSERLGEQHITLAVQHAAINVIVHHDNVRELQVTVHEVTVRFQDRLVLLLKPDRDVMQLKQLRESVVVKWRLEKAACTIEGDLALVLNEAYHAYNEKTQSAFIKCGTCAQQIRLENIETHVCGPLPVRSPASSTTTVGARHLSNVGDSAVAPRLRLVFALNELELNCDSHLFHNVQQLMHSSSRVGADSSRNLADRKLAVRANDLRITTEAKEFVGDAIFVPVLPLAFQMLDSALSEMPASPRLMAMPRWPERVFVELGLVKCSASRTACPSVESFFVAEQVVLRASFSDGERVCANCQPQLSAHVAVSRVRCQLDHGASWFVKEALGSTAAAYEGELGVVALLFLAVLEIRAVEFTLLQDDSSGAARLKNLFKHVSVVGDNQLGHLTLQSSLDFRSLFYSQVLRFFHRDSQQADAASTASSPPPPPPPSPSRKNSKSAASLFGVPEDLVNANRKVAAAASVLSNFVKSKQQQLESEVVGLAVHSKESAARLVLPPFAAYKKMFGRESTTPTGATPKYQRISVQAICAGQWTANRVVVETELTATNCRQTREELKQDDGKDNDDDEGDALDHGPTPVEQEEDDAQHLEAEFPLSDTGVLARLPELVRVLVQVDVHRLRVPISPREKVGFLCREVVRRFNEMFAAQSGFVSCVVLQDARGGAFLPTDIVGFVYASEADVVFAVPVKADERVRCVARIAPCEPSHSTATMASRRHAAAKPKAAGRSFARCSKLPLPLAIVLLANESERDLMRCVLSEGSYGAAGNGHANEWPELALDVSFLDPAHILPVEVRWFGECLEVTNADAFVLCLQQLGLCTSRASSKYVGKILRDRLKMDRHNPLIRAACARSGDFDVGSGTEQDAESCETASSEAGDASGAIARARLFAISYESLKQVVQDEYGVYTTR